MISLSQKRVRELLGLKSKENVFSTYWKIGVSLIILTFICWVFYPSRKIMSSHERRSLPFESTDNLSDNLQWLASHVTKKSERRGGYLKYHQNLKHLNAQLSQPLHKDIFLKQKRIISSSGMEAPMEIFSRDKKEKEQLTSQEHPILKRSDPSHFLLAGEVIQATVESAVNTDFSGPIRAIVSRPVYSYKGKHVLIPAGSRLLGEYQQVVHEGQERIWIRWGRVILPEGSSVWLDAPSTDGLGRVGTKADHVNHHAWMRFREASLLSLLSGGAMLADGLNASTETAGQQFRSDVANQLSEAAQKSWVSHRTISPTASLDPGHRIMVYVMHDVDFQSLTEEAV